MFEGEGRGPLATKRSNTRPLQHSSSIPARIDLEKDAGEGRGGTGRRVGRQAGASGYFRESLLRCFSQSSYRGTKTLTSCAAYDMLRLFIGLLFCETRNKKLPQGRVNMCRRAE